jgi:cytochrome c-type biogenesis protein CcmH
VRLRLLLAALAGVPAWPPPPTRARLADPAQEARARAIFADVRCLVCQNESIDDSEADLAHDLRQIVREQVEAGKSPTEIKAFLTQRYGEFVLLTPTFSAGNLALWGAPLLVVAVGALFSSARGTGRPTRAGPRSGAVALITRKTLTRSRPILTRTEP